MTADICPECKNDNAKRFRCIHWFADQIGAPVQWVRHNMRAVPSHRRGRLVRFTEGDVDEFEAATKVEREPDIALSDLSRARKVGAR